MRRTPLALAALGAVYALLAALPAARGSNVVLATTGGSPGWLLGPLRFAGAPGADGPLAGPLFYVGLWVALALYAFVLVHALELSPRALVGAIAALHVLFLLAPPLLSQDVFSYIAYGRLGALHDLNPYTSSPADMPGDAVFAFAGSKGAVSVYGPVFTLLTYPLASLGVPAAFWALKTLAAAASLGIVWVVWRCAQALGRDPRVAAACIGLNPLVLVHVVGGAHNEALVVLVTMAGVAWWVADRGGARGSFVATLAAGVKASAGIAVPFLVAGARLRGRAIAAAALGAVLLGAVALAAFGTDALGGLVLVSSNQEQGSCFSLPFKVAQLARIADGGAGLHCYAGDSVPGLLRALFAAGSVVAVALLLWRTWQRRIDPLAAIGWATLAVLLGTAWLLPWYALWLLPFAALAGSRRLLAASIALSAWMLAIAVPL